MFNDIFVILIILNISGLVWQLPQKFQETILNSLKLDNVPLLNKRPMSNCVDFLSNLKSPDELLDEVRCHDPTEVNKKILKFSIESSGQFDKWTIGLFQRQSFANESVYLIISNVNNEETNFIIKQLHTSQDAGQWIEIDVTRLIERKREDLHEISFEIKCFLNQTDLTIELNDAIAFDKPFRPYLITFVRKLERSGRFKRQNDREDDEEDLGPYLDIADDKSMYCDSVPIYYKFEDYGWEHWIISPKGFTSSFCRGRCSFPLKKDANPTNHAIIQSLMQLMYPDKYPEPCCVADRTEPLQIVYFDKENTPRFKRLNDIIIKSCRCA